MKVNKLKTLLYCLGASTLLTTLSVDATSLSINKSSSTDTTAVYEVYLEPTEEVSNITIKFKSSDVNIKPQIRKADNVEAVCDTYEYCAVTGTYSSKIKIADVTLENTTESQIDDLSLSVSVDIEESGTVTSDPISLKGKEVITTTQKALSTASELSNLTLSVDSATIEPAFNVSERSYTIKGIKDTVSSITFNPTCENCTTEFVCIENCTVSETKNNRIMLEDGANTLKLTTTSEDGKNKTEYNFTVYKGEIEEPSAYLEEVSLKDVEISPKFDMLLNDYSATVDLDVEKIEIDYKTEDPEATVDIKGNDKLQEGENIITITVTSSDSKSKQVYTITVNKEDICDPEKEDCDKEEVKETIVVEKKKTNKTWLIILLVVGALAIIGVSGFIIFKKKKKNNNKKKDKNDKSGKGEKIKNVFIEPDEEQEPQLEDELLKEDSEEKTKEDIIKPRIKPSVDEALEDLMKTKEIELNNL